VGDLTAAQAAVYTAQSQYDTAQVKLKVLRDGATPADRVAAQTTVDSAQASLTAARAKLDVLRAGAADTDLRAARAAVDSAKASQDGAQIKLDQVRAGAKDADLEAARSSVVQAQSAYATKVGPVKETDLAIAMEGVKTAELAVRQAELDLQASTLVAPFGGVVSALNANLAEQASSSIDKPVVALIDPADVRINATVDEVDVAKLAPGKPAEISFDALPERRFRGTVVAVAPSGVLQSGVVTYPITVSLNARDATLPSGLTAALTIFVNQKDGVLVVPLRAIRRQGRDQVVDVLTADGKTEPRPIQVGLATDQLAEIVDGLQEGEQVLVAGTTTAPVRPGSLPGANPGGPPGANPASPGGIPLPGGRGGFQGGGGRAPGGR
jgi:HlyD family secretion protein